jgi:hypothetical protein
MGAADEAKTISANASLPIFNICGSPYPADASAIADANSESQQSAA